MYNYGFRCVTTAITRALASPPCQSNRSLRLRPERAPVCELPLCAPRLKSRWHGSCPWGVHFQPTPTTTTSITPRPANRSTKQHYTYSCLHVTPVLDKQTKTIIRANSSFINLKKGACISHRTEEAKELKQNPHVSVKPKLLYTATYHIQLK